jgi:hypothetical protein
MEEFFRTAYAASAEVRVAVNEILETQSRRVGAGAARRGPVPRARVSSAPRPEVPKPRRTARRAPQRASRGDDRLPIIPADVGWAKQLFTAAPFRGAPLSPETCKFVVFGHTHAALEEALGNGATYSTRGPGDHQPQPLDRRGPMAARWLTVGLSAAGLRSTGPCRGRSGRRF